MNRRTLWAAFLCGLLFAVGLGISGMTRPAKVIGFLDPFGGAWDPSLALVMAAAIAVHAPLYRWMRARSRVGGGGASVSGELGDGCGSGDDEDELSAIPGAGTRVERKRVWLGAAIFGIGWGLGGYCPGPAVVSLVSLAPGVVVFVGAMLAGMLLFQAMAQPRSSPRDRPSSALPSL